MFQVEYYFGLVDSCSSSEDSPVSPPTTPVMSEDIAARLCHPLCQCEKCQHIQKVSVLVRYKSSIIFYTYLCIYHTPRRTPFTSVQLYIEMRTSCCLIQHQLSSVSQFSRYICFSYTSNKTKKV